LNILDQVVATGVDVLKIEGRARSPEYIATVTKVYKQALLAVEQKAFTDECKKDLMKELEKVYNRGFSTGFFLGRPAEDGWAHSANSVATEKKEFAGFVSNYFKKIHVAEITLKAGKLVDGNSVYIQGKKTGVERIEINGIRYHPDSTITFPCSLRIKSGDEVYRIVPNKS